MACDIQELIDENPCFMALSRQAQLAVIAALLCTISSGGLGGQLYTGSAADPNGTTTPTSPLLPALYYQDDPLLLNLWKWSVADQVWYQML